MKPYAVPLSLLGAALMLAAGLAYLIADDPGAGILVNLIIGAGLVVAVGAVNPDLFRQYGRWLNAVWGAVMVLGIIVLVNYLAEKYPERLDLTAGKLHSLSDLTIATLSGLDADVQALAFMEGGTDEKLEALLKGYGVHSERFTFQFLDLDNALDKAKDYGVRRYNTLVLEAKESGKRHPLTELNEKEITNALLKVTRNRSELVYFTAGHGEKSAAQGENDYGLLAGRLREIDYAVRDSLMLARAGKVPEDCAVLVIAGPQTPFLAPELEAVREYLQAGGAVLALLDPVYESGLDAVLSEWGVILGDDFVIDTSGVGSLFGLDFTTPVSVSYGDHPITTKHQGIMTFYQLVRSVGFAPGRAGVEGVELVTTSADGWAESDLSVLSANGQRTVRMDPDVDRSGPVSLGVAVVGDSGGDRKSRLVVFGDSDFASNFYFNQQGNGDLALNALSWLAEDESLISIRPREAGFNPIALTDNQADWIFWFGVILYPALVALVGIMVVSRKGRWSLRDLAAAGLGVVLSLGVLFLVNFLGGRYHHRIDLTEDELFTLSSKTQDIIEPLEERNRFVTVKAFVAEILAPRYKEILEEYEYLSPNFDFELLDPQKHALLVKQYGIRERGTSVVEVTGDGRVRSERLTEQSEEALSNAIRRALRSEDHKIYFTAGHEEGRLSDMDGKGFSILKGRLREMNFAVDEGLDLSRDGLPADASVIAVIGPKSRFTLDEVDALEAHLQGGGGALFLLDPGVETGLKSFLDKYSIDLGDDFVVDASGLGQLLLGADVSVPVVTQYGIHAITETIQRGVMSYFPWARTVSPTEHRNVSPEVTTLLTSHQTSWGEADLGPLFGTGDGKVSFDPVADLRGPVSLALAVKADPDSAGRTGKVRIVVFGDSDFASNQYFGEQANGELLSGSLSWLAEAEDRLDIPDKQARSTPIALQGTQATTILWTSVFVLPFAIALSGLVMMLRRGYETYVTGFISWLMYTFLGAAVFYFAVAVVNLGENNLLVGEGYLILALVSAAVSFALFRRQMRIWAPALVLAILNAGIGFTAIPIDTVQWLFAALFIATAAILAILVWIKKAV